MADLHCPRCRVLSTMPVSATQAMCVSDDCDVWIFNPTLPDGGLSNAQQIELIEAVPGEGWTDVVRTDPPTDAPEET